ncbi:hypothetical protein ACTHGN_000286 [Pseudomonas putida]
MFETHAKAIAPSTFDYDKGLLELDFVSQRFHAEWFYITQHIRTDDGELSSRMLLIDDISEFKALLSARTKAAWVKDIYLVTPGTINKTGTWAIDSLLEVKEISPSPMLANRNFIYKIKNTTDHYFSTDVDGTWENLPFKIIYKRNTPT